MALLRRVKRTEEFLKKEAFGTLRRSKGIYSANQPRTRGQIWGEIVLKTRAEYIEIFEDVLF